MPAHDGLWSNKYDAPCASSSRGVARRSKTAGHAPASAGDCSPASSPSAAAGAPGSPGPVLDVHGVPAPAHDRQGSTAGACLDPGWRGRQNQLGRVLARVTVSGERPARFGEPQAEAAWNGRDWFWRTTGATAFSLSFAKTRLILKAGRVAACCRHREEQGWAPHIRRAPVPHGGNAALVQRPRQATSTRTCFVERVIPCVPTSDQSSRCRWESD